MVGRIPPGCRWVVLAGSLEAMDFQKLFAGAVSLMNGAQQLNDALREGREQRRRRPALATAAPSHPSEPSKMVMSTHQVRNIKERVKFIQKQVAKARNDPRFRALAVKVVSKKCGTKHCIRERDYIGEVRAVYNYIRQNVRYVRDPLHADLFQHPKRTLEFGGGDCFPEGTMLLTPDGFVPVENLEVGDTIHDGERWVDVLQTWDRGPKTIVRADLNNGSSLRLSDNHKVLRVPRGLGGNRPGEYGSAEEALMSDLRVGDDLLQPRSFMAGGDEEWDEDDAYLAGAYLAEGCRVTKKKGSDVFPEISLAGVVGGKGVRERVEEILESRGIRFRKRDREIRFRATDWPKSEVFGRISIEKHLPHFRFGPRTIATMVAALEQGDAGVSSGGNTVFSTVSKELALAYRVLKRMEGFSTSMATVVAHGGFGANPIHRLTVRRDHIRRPWAKVRSITVEDEQVHCYDLMTTSGRVYLPESDVITRQCDDYTITLGAMLESIGYPVKARVIQTVESPDFDHIYLMVGIPPHSEAPRWLALDASVSGKKPGWQPPHHMVKRYKDFPIS